ncbi:NirD/YgiW/YdeI family stress tolerance protein [Roseibacillus persicicus]|uniref:NirD/YgiW/YdeI family stress tolerance protein n=1 Tax=Roseibacillus persicicus TaxID=454148 RepID=UPI00280D9F6C|nr:NirD/YgiW/YdeI family stress tolerance protein [Roseibacillus persicicus]MDQ8189100.1 NirD/YgiW/YdeI family stress tolerance protein [Roseibacillus persicicus]
MKAKYLKTLSASALALFSAGTLFAASPYTMPNNSWIELDGKVTEVNSRSFLLDYGKGEIRVEIDDYDFFEEAYNVIENDRVKVRGKVDADPNEERTIEASAVVLKDHGVTLRANAEDEEDIIVKFVTPSPVVHPALELRGTIERFEDGKMILQTATHTHRIDLDDASLRNMRGALISDTLRVGDFLSVVGVQDKKLFGTDEFDANTVYLLKKITE